MEGISRRPMLLSSRFWPRRFSANLILFFATSCLAQTSYDFHISHRINVHGDEFNSLARTSDGTRLVIGTEKGSLLIWSIAERKIVKQLEQGTPIHKVAALADARFVMTAGGPHTGQNRYGVVRKWNIDTGAFEDFKPASATAFLTADSDGQLFAAANGTGDMTVWDSAGRVIAARHFDEIVTSLALAGRSVILTGINLEALNTAQANGQAPANSIIALSIDGVDQSPQRITRDQPGKIWSDVAISPDGRFLTAKLNEEVASSIILLDRASGREITRFRARASVVWSKDGQLVAFGLDMPSDLVEITTSNDIVTTDVKSSGAFRAAGTPTDLKGAIVSEDRTLVWEVLRMGSALAQCNLSAKSCELLYQIPGNAYAMDIVEPSGIVATGGDDGFIRIWKQADFSLRKELRVLTGVPQSVAFSSDGKTLVYSASGREAPTEILSVDVTSGQEKSLLKIPKPFVRIRRAADGFVYALDRSVVHAELQTGKTRREFKVDSSVVAYATSLNGSWLAAGDDKGMLHLFDLKAGREVARSTETRERPTQIAVTNDGQSVYTTEFSSSLKNWQPASNATTEVTGVTGQTESLFVSADGQWLAVGGNHRDIVIYNAKSGEAVFATRIPDADFFVTNAWISGDRLIFTTDAGVLFSGTLR